MLASVSRTGGGVTEVARAVAHRLSAGGAAEVRIFGLRDSWTETDASLWNPLVVRTCDVVGPRAFGYAPGLHGLVQLAQADIVHCHGLWMYTSIVAQRNSGVRPREVISPHGMLDGWALKNSRWKKYLAGLFFENAHLRGAACLHALGAQELAAMREIGLRNPVCVIPNGIAPLLAHDAGGLGNFKDALGVAPPQRVLLYLGRIHPKKGLTNLLEAWALVRQKRLPGTNEWTLAIAGWEEAAANHQQELRLQADGLRLADSVVFPGPLFGPEKTAALRRAAAFVLASFSEGMPMTVLEAWAHRLPVIMTPQCNLPEGFQAEAALRVDPTVASLTDGLARLFAMSDADRQRMGDAGRRLVEERFSWDRAAEQLSSVYRWLLGGGAPPACVDLAGARSTHSGLLSAEQRVNEN